MPVTSSWSSRGLGSGARNYGVDFGIRLEPQRRSRLSTAPARVRLGPLSKSRPKSSSGLAIENACGGRKEGRERRAVIGRKDDGKGLGKGKS